MVFHSWNGVGGRTWPAKTDARLTQASAGIADGKLRRQLLYPSQTQSRLKSALEDNLVTLSRWPGLVDPTRVLIA